MEAVVELPMEQYTPSVDELLPNYQIKCLQPQCDAVFTNVGNYGLHLLRRHRMPVAERQQHRLCANTRFFCPISECVYNANRAAGGKFFKNMKYLRQHFQKVHAEKEHTCKSCCRKFSTPGLLQSHKDRVCGRKFVCRTCAWEYTSMEALLTHGKRKGHAIREEREHAVTKVKTPKAAKVTTAKVAIPRLPLPEGRKRHTPSVPHKNEVSRRLCSMAVQTDYWPRVAPTLMDMCTSTNFPELDDIHSLLRDIETQTEFSLRSPANNQGVYMDPMLGVHSAHMCTQTCEDILSELGLASDIETQTHWQSLAGINTTSTATSTSCAHDELLVSTETQTSFTQCLLDCSTTPHVECVDVGVSAFGSLSQQTQTCDTLLGEDTATFFGGPESELMGGLHSAYTQT